MPRVLFAAFAALLSILVLAAAARAENEGQADLDKATELKLNAENNPRALGQVIDLCSSALTKGLDESNAEFARQLLASTRIQRGTMTARAAVETMALRKPQWEQLRKYALDDLEQGVELMPAEPQAQLLIAQLQLLPGGDRARATDALAKAIEVAGDEPAVKAKALLLRAGLADDDAKRLADLDEAVRTAPASADTVRTRGLIHAEMKNFDKAVADFDKAIELAPDELAAYEGKADVLIRQEKFDEALAVAEKARQVASEQVEPLLLKARIHGLAKDFAAAGQDLDQAHEIDPANPVVLLLRASVLQELKQPEKALADVNQALELRPGNPVAMRIRAAILAGSGRFAEAVRQLEDLQKAAPDDLQVALDLAMVYTGEQKPHQAIELYTKVLAEQPESVLAIRGRADAYLNVGKHAEAIADFEKALSLKPDDDGVLNNLAWVLCTTPDDKLRDGKRALELATKACELTEYKEGHILSTLAAAYAETGDFETAIKWSEKAVAAGKDEQKEALQKELESYRQKKPVRELLTAPAPDEPVLPTLEESEKPNPEGQPATAPAASPQPAAPPAAPQ